jgi:hypothetical protein
VSEVDVLAAAVASPGRRLGMGAVASTCGGAARDACDAGAVVNRLSPALSIKRANAAIGDSARAAVAPSKAITITGNSRRTTHPPEAKPLALALSPKRLRHSLLKALTM